MRKLVVFIFTFVVLHFWSCDQDNSNSNKWLGTYVIDRIDVTICPQAYFIDFQENQNCAKASNFDAEYCREGFLYINEDYSVVSSIRVSGNGPLYGDILNIKGTGTISIDGDNAIICFGNSCEDYIINGDYITSSTRAIGCEGLYTYKKMTKL